MRTRIGMVVVCVLIVGVVVGIVQAQAVPQLINYQGRLTDAAGQPLRDGTKVDLTFTFYGTESGGTAYLTVLQKEVVVSGGIYNVLIGSGKVTPGTEPNLGAVFQNHQEVWMGVKVDSDREMSPRARIASVPYALKVEGGWLTAFYNKSDYDGDGYSKIVDGATAITDCNDVVASINPSASEVCGDGIDNDCDGKIDGADNDALEVCDDTIDNDCDGLIDGKDPECQEGNIPGMALIPAGCFDMGDHFNAGDSDELPVHNVCITSDFYMDIHEVTNAEYAACVEAESCSPPSDTSSYLRSEYYGNPMYDDFPVIYVSWHQASKYCTWAGKRLPTEAEWEYAARGGLSGNCYPWGNYISGTDANYWDSGDPWDNDTSKVGYYAANGYGLYDMAGNVCEWVNDWYSPDYYSSSPTKDPQGPDTGTYNVFRGGSWLNSLDLLRVADRDYGTPSSQLATLGFRCVQH